MKENKGYFRLAHILRLLEGELHEEHSLLGEGILIEDLLHNHGIL